MTKTEPLLLTEAQAADRLQLCARTLRKARQEGKLRFVRVGRTVRYTIGDLESFIDSQRKVEPECPGPMPPASPKRRPSKGGKIIPFTVRNAPD